MHPGRSPLVGERQVFDIANGKGVDCAIMKTGRETISYNIPIFDINFGLSN